MHCGCFCTLMNTKWLLLHSNIAKTCLWLPICPQLPLHPFSVTYPYTESTDIGGACKIKGALKSSSITASYLYNQGRIQDSEKGGHNYVTVSMVIVCEVHNLGGSGGMPPGNFQKLNPLRLNLRAFLMVYCLY